MLNVGGDVLPQIAALAAADVEHLDAGRIRMAVLACQSDELVHDQRLDPVVEAAHADDLRLVALFEAGVLDLVVVLGDQATVAAVMHLVDSSFGHLFVN